MDTSGSKSGLSLVLNVEQYEYMRGPQNDAGIKVSAKPSSGKFFHNYQSWQSCTILYKVV